MVPIRTTRSRAALWNGAEEASDIGHVSATQQPRKNLKRRAQTEKRTCLFSQEANRPVQTRRKKTQKNKGEETSPGANASARNKKMKPAAVAEKRLARFRSAPPVDKIERVFTHKLYLIEKIPSSSEKTPPSCDFVVLGATGNVYTVTIDVRPSCTCPDHAKGNICKHILFIMIRVLKLREDEPRAWQKALLSSELQDIMKNVSDNDNVGNTVMASCRIRQKYKEMIATEGVHSGDAAVQREICGDCPVCYEPMADGDGKDSEALIFCKTCGNNVHRECFRKWSQTRALSGKVTCIYCRAEWQGDGSKAECAGEYINLAPYSNVHKPEETSYEALYPRNLRWSQGRNPHRNLP